MSIRVRLTLWYVALLCAGLALFAGATLWLTGQAANASLNQTLVQRATDVADDLRFGRAIGLRTDAPDESNRQLGEVALRIRVLDPRGHIAVSQGPSLPASPTGFLSDTRPGLREYTLADGQHVRVYTLPVMRAGQRAATVQILTTTHPIDETRGELIAAMGAAAVLIVAIATLGGLFLAYKALQPVDRITRLAGEIGADDLHRRVGDEMWGNARHGTGHGKSGADEIVRLARTFDAMLGRLQEAEERRRRLTADAAHELGTPLATITSSLEIALRRPRDADAYRATLRHVLDECHHLGRVLGDLLLLAQADAGRLPLHRELVEIDEVCRHAARAFGPLAAERGVSLTTTLPTHATLVLGDELRLGQVVRNLLDNALRYTPSGGSVTLALREEDPPPRVARTLALHVRDTGPGIAPSEKERVFERFHRAAGAVPLDSRSEHDIAGSGLGLAICKAIVEAHGGRIHIDSIDSGAGDGMAESPEGAHVVVVLPAIAEGGDDDGVGTGGAALEEQGSTDRTQGRR